MNLLPESKRAFGHPVPAEALPWFCHPEPGHIYHAPVFGADGNLYCSNGYIAVRFFNFTESFGTGGAAMLERLQGLGEWYRSPHEDATAWRKLDDCTLDLFRDGVLPMWDASSGKARYCVAPAVAVNARVVPAASLQLVSRLPRAEVFTAPERHLPVPFRFNGGEGLMARLSDKQTEKAGRMLCRIFFHHTT